MIIDVIHMDDEDGNKTNVMFLDLDLFSKKLISSGCSNYLLISLKIQKYHRLFCLIKTKRMLKTFFTPQVFFFHLQMVILPVTDFQV